MLSLISSTLLAETGDTSCTLVLRHSQVVVVVTVEDDGELAAHEVRLLGA